MGRSFFTQNMAKLTGVCGQSPALSTIRQNAPSRSLGCLLAEYVETMEAVKATLGPSRTTGWPAYPEFLGLGRSVLGGGGCEGVLSSALYLRHGTWGAHVPGEYSHPGLGSPEHLGETLEA